MLADFGYHFYKRSVVSKSDAAYITSEKFLLQLSLMRVATDDGVTI